jgi:type IX secretion system PorP/SprF family membrane protein
MNLLNKISVTLVMCFFSCIYTCAQQQTENSISQYFANPSLWNPAFAGVGGGKAFIFQNRSWVGFDGAPVITGLATDFNFGKNAAGGVQLISDVSGILYRTTAVLQYAYRVKFTEEKQLQLGIAATVLSDRLNFRSVDQQIANDPLLANSLNRTPQFDGSFGMAYQSNKLTFGASFFRLRENMSTNSIKPTNMALAQFSLQYTLTFGSEKAMQISPLLMTRLYKASDAIIDIGAQFSFAQYFHCMAVYQSVGNIRAGLGLKKATLGELNFFYNTNAKITTVSSQQYEIGLGIYFRTKKD